MQFVAILSLLLLTVTQGQCPAYVVNPSNVNWTPQECGMPDPKNTTQYDLRTGVCTASEVCKVAGHIESVNCTVVPTPTPAPESYPGEPCDVNHLCYSGECTNSYCPGLKPGDDCVHVQDCGGSLTCGSAGTCVELAAEGENCAVDTDCVQNSGCDIGTGAGPWKCTGYLSIAPQQPVQSCGDGLQPTNQLVENPFCASTLCYVPSQGTPLCSDVLSSASNLPQRCAGPDDKSCVSNKDSVAGTTIINPCQCGYDGYYYCALFPGDAVMQTFLKDVSTWLADKSWLVCNTNRNNGELPTYTRDWCTENSTSPTHQMLFDEFQATAYQMIANAPNATLDFLWPQYYTPTPTPTPTPGDFSAWLGCSGMLLVALQ